MIKKKFTFSEAANWDKQVGHNKLSQPKYNSENSDEQRRSEREKNGPRLDILLN